MMDNINEFYKRFVDEAYDENGVVCKFDLDLPDNYNFAYDVIDAIAAIEPDRVALHWLSENGEERIFTFRDLSEQSIKAANMLRDHGVEKGDAVMVVLKRHYEFWIVAYALIRLGAVLIPATCQLMKKDYIYRFDLARVKYIITTGEDNVTEHVDQALEE